MPALQQRGTRSELSPPARAPSPQPQQTPILRSTLQCGVDQRTQCVAYKTPHAPVSFQPMYVVLCSRRTCQRNRLRYGPHCNSTPLFHRTQPQQCHHRCRCWFSNQGCSGGQSSTRVPGTELDVYRFFFLSSLSASTSRCVLDDGVHFCRTFALLSHTKLLQLLSRHHRQQEAMRGSHTRQGLRALLRRQLPGRQVPQILT